MTIDARLLTLTQWLSPAYPTGAFAFSSGLEQAVHAGWVQDANDLELWLDDVLSHGTGHTDAIWMRLAYDTDEIVALNGWAQAFCASASRRVEAGKQGAAFVSTTNSVWGLDLPPLLLPLAIGRAARLAGLEVEPAIALSLQAMVSNACAAAIRLSVMGQTGAQQVSHALAQRCIDTARTTQGATLDDIQSTAWAADIAAMRHETLSPRLFQT